MHSATGFDYTYRYPFASYFGVAEERCGLWLATCGRDQDHPYFFRGRIRRPRLVGDALLVLCQVVRTHFFRRVPANLDPVVTCSECMLRFEGFSGCCGVYARVDLSADAFEGEILGRGTTNVDFNQTMRSALGQLGEYEEATLSVGRDNVRLTRASESVIEKKVKLPVRWIKAFSEVQAYQPDLELKLEVPVAEGRRFLRSLPGGTGATRTTYVVQSGRELRLTQVVTPGMVSLQGTNRIRVLEPLLARARKLRIWGDDKSGTSGWEVVFDTGKFFLMLSPELYRGFSGEGQILERLAGRRWQEALPYVQSQLAWQSQIDGAKMAEKLGLTVEEVDAALAVLGSRGLVGFDVTTSRYFHRELPFDLDQIDKLQPRLKTARRLLETGEVQLLTDFGEDTYDLSVQGTDVSHLVRLRPDGDRCTCPWFSKNRGVRGPCKHILAARIFLDESSPR